MLLETAPISIGHIFSLGHTYAHKDSLSRVTAIAVGKKTLLACAGSLASISEEPDNLRSRRFYCDHYWIQSPVKTSKGQWNREENRIPVTLYKFHSVNNWALFVRTDGQEFPSFATIDRTSAALPDHMLPDVSRPVYILHCPVSVRHAFQRPPEYVLTCYQKLGCVITAQSSHQVCYDGRNLLPGSTGGAVQWADSQLLFAMHCEIIPEVRDREEFEMAPSPKDVYYEGKLSLQTSLEVDKEDTEGNPPLKKLKTAGETHLPVEPIYNLCGGHPGQGRAIVLSKFPRLLYHIDEIEENTP